MPAPRLRFELSTVILAAILSLVVTAADAKQPNVLMLWVDDLRPQMQCYGVQEMQTPNLDRLAAQSLKFNRAYCNIAVCGASRASVMTGIRPTKKRFVSYTARADKETPKAVTLNEHFQAAGYYTAGYGKIFHFEEDSANGWDEINDYYAWPGYTKPENLAQWDDSKKTRGPFWEIADVQEEELMDGKIARTAAAAITRLAVGEKPFFIAAGFYKPHLPFVAPKKYWDQYPMDAIKLPANYRTKPDVPRPAPTYWGELRSYAGIPKRGPVDEPTARRLIAGYQACVSFTDAQLGHVLDALKASGQAENTIVVLLGDHGWNLGDHGMWCKHCCFETSMRTPLMVAAPMLAGFKPGTTTQALTEFVDLYPTLCELTEVEAPKQLMGDSMTNVLANPTTTHRTAAFGRYGQGDTVRTDRFRYTQYHDWQGNYQGHMLYDHDNDPAEDRNIVEEAEYAEVVAELSQMLEERLAE